jgi:hypothetical protein
VGCLIRSLVGEDHVIDPDLGVTRRSTGTVWAE